MGLFGDIARAAANAALSTAKDMIGDAAAAKIGQQVGVGKSISFRGECERPVYVYYGEPLRKIRKGDVFDAEVVTKPMRLRSELTGGVWDTTDDGFALAYKGKVFGAASALGNTFKDITELGYRITVSCRMTGWYAKGIPTSPRRYSRGSMPARALGATSASRKGIPPNASRPPYRSAPGLNCRRRVGENCRWAWTETVSTSRMTSGPA